jgi:hypothetical protein
MHNIRHIASVAFPPFGGRYINMMPFVMGDDSSIPPEFHDFLPMINSCPIGNEAGKIGYLTIDERYVKNGTHRRSGIHTEGFANHSWGGGHWGGSGGLYLANSVDDSCILYDANIDETPFGGAVSGEQVANARSVLMPADNVFWIHDRTPHASLPCRGSRQFFRLVTSEVSVWFSKHSTPNRLGIQPAARIIHSDKFEMIVTAA